VRQGGTGERQQEEQPDEWECGEEDESLVLDVDGELLTAGRYYCNDGNDHVDGVVVNDFASDFGEETGRMERSKEAHAIAMETEADEVVLNVPYQHGKATKGCDEHRQIKVWVTELPPIETQNVEQEADPKEGSSVF
jgi:hypothetical protein